MRLLTKEEKIIYDFFMKDILKKVQMKTTKPPKGFDKW